MDAQNLANSGNQAGHSGSKGMTGREDGLNSQNISREEEMNSAFNEEDMATHGTGGSEQKGISDNGEGALIPGFSDDIAILCLIRVPREFIPVLRKVCKRWKRLVEREDYPLLRKRLIKGTEVNRAPMVIEVTVPIPTGPGLNYSAMVIQVGSSEGWIHVLPEIPAAGPFRAYSPQSNKWHTLPLIPGWSSGDCWQGFACVAIGHRLFLMGGVQRTIDVTAQNSTTGVVSASVKVYNACTNQWSTAKCMNTPRSWFAATVIGDLIYVAGGQGNIKFLDTAEVYDSKNDVWQVLPNMNCVRSSCRGITLNHQFWVIGGEYARHQYGIEPSKGSAEVYDPAAKTWMLVPEMGLDTHKVPWPTTLHNGQLLSVRYNKVMAYDGETNQWMHIGNVLGWDGYGNPSCRTRYGFAFESVGNEVYIIGGTQVCWFNFLKRSIQDVNTVEISNLQDRGISKILTWWNGMDMDDSRGTILASVVMYL